MRLLSPERSYENREEPLSDNLSPGIRNSMEGDGPGCSGVVIISISPSVEPTMSPLYREGRGTMLSSSWYSMETVKYSFGKLAASIIFMTIQLTYCALRKFSSYKKN